MADFSPGPKLNLQGKALATQLCLILDDHSRLIVSGSYYPAADTPAFHHALKEAVQRRGVPYKLYTDLGKPFTSKHTQIVCANLKNCVCFPVPSLIRCPSVWCWLVTTGFWPASSSEFMRPCAAGSDTACNWGRSIANKVANTSNMACAAPAFTPAPSSLRRWNS